MPLTDRLSASSIWRLRCGIAADVTVLWLARLGGGLAIDSLCADLAAKYRLLSAHHRVKGHRGRSAELERRAQEYLHREDEDDGLLVAVPNSRPKPRPPLAAARPLPHPPVLVEAIGRLRKLNRIGG